MRSENKQANKWLERILSSNHVLWMVFLASMLESTVVPIPLELLLIPLIIHEHERWFAIATAALLGCLVGATIGYTIGFWFFDDIGQAVLSWLGYEDAFQSFTERFNDNGFATLLLVGITPIPFQVGMIAAGSAEYPYPLYMLAALIARGIRYYGLALLVQYFGERVLHWWQQHNRRLGWVVLILGLSAYTLYLTV